MKRYVPDGKNAYRIKLSTYGYADGLNLVNHLSKYAGDRGIRAMLYRPPPRVLLFQPQLLATVELDDPPEPDSVFGFLAPEKRLKGLDIDRRVNPRRGRFFGRGHITQRAEGCLVGYGTTTGEKDGPYGVGRYAFFVADRFPYMTSPGEWWYRFWGTPVSAGGMAMAAVVALMSTLIGLA